MKTISDRHFTGERAEFCSRDKSYENCLFDDGESPLKESCNIVLNNCRFGWKYPVWYSDNAEISDCTWFETARSGVWYTKNVRVENSRIIAPKNFRRCKNVALSNVEFENAVETLWACENVGIENVKVRGDYFGMNSRNIRAKNLLIDGNYCFDGGENIEICDSVLNSKDSFWNVKNATAKNCVIIGEYIGWNSKNLTFIDCHIESNQGFCYIDGLTLKNCTLEKTCLAFEYCENVDADIKGVVDSVKNPYSGRIIADGYGEIIMESDKVDTQKTVIATRGKE